MKKPRGLKWNINFVGLELEALSVLLHRWAQPVIVKKRASQWRARIPALRKAVIAGLAKKGKRNRPERVAHEIVEDDYRAVRDAVLWMKKQKKSGMQLTEMKRHIKTGLVPAALMIDRPFPAPERLCERIARDLLNNFVPAAEIAYYITAERLGLAPETVRNAVKKRRAVVIKVPPRRIEDQQMASLLLDIASFPGAEARRLRDSVFQILIRSRYPSLSLYYLVQACQQIPSEISMRLCDEPSINIAFAAVLNKGS